MQRETDLVVFRRWRDTGDLIALFPEIPADVHGLFCSSYEQIGQHGAADYWGVLQQTRPAGIEECTVFAEELQQIGYNLQPVKRAERGDITTDDDRWRLSTPTEQALATKPNRRGNGMNTMSIKPKFHPGQVLATPGALAALEESGQTPEFFLARHIHGDWGEELCEEDRRLNDQSLVDGSRLLSAYRTMKGEKLWIVTEAVDDTGDRACSTILFPSEY